MGIWLKGIDGALELVGGFLLAVLPGAVLTKMLLFLTPHVIGSGTKDWIYQTLSRGLERLVCESTFAIFYLLSHGVVKVFLAIALLREIQWAFPVAMGVFGLLAGYEMYQFVAHPSVMMGVIIALDLSVLALIESHWRSERRKRRDVAQKCRASTFGDLIHP